MTVSPTIGPVSSGWGKRKAKIPGMTTFHKGVDIGVPTGTPVVAPQAGVVAVSRYSLVRGHYVVVDHGGGWATLHQHLSKRLVTVGQRVAEGERLGLSGRTGNVTGPHLHTEVQDHGTPIDPDPWYLARGAILGSASRAASHPAQANTSREDDDMERILISHDARRGYWYVAPGHAHQFNQNPDYTDEFTGFMARHPGIRVYQYPAGDDGVRDFDIDKGVFTQPRL